MRIRFPFAIALAFAMVAFLTTACYAQNGIVSPEDRVTITQGQNTGVWRGKDLNVEYHFSRGQGETNLSGIVRFADHMTYSFNLLRDFRLVAIFLDENGKVIATQGITTERGNLDPIRFQKKLAVPAAAAAMSFSYHGVAVESGLDGGNGTTSFWQDPIH